MCSALRTAEGGGTGHLHTAARQQQQACGSVRLSVHEATLMPSQADLPHGPRWPLQIRPSRAVLGPSRFKDVCVFIAFGEEGR